MPDRVGPASRGGTHAATLARLQTLRQPARGLRGTHPSDADAHSAALRAGCATPPRCVPDARLRRSGVWRLHRVRLDVIEDRVAATPGGATRRWIWVSSRPPCSAASTASASTSGLPNALTISRTQPARIPFRRLAACRDRGTDWPRPSMRHSPSPSRQCRCGGGVIEAALGPSTAGRSGVETAAASPGSGVESGLLLGTAEAGHGPVGLRPVCREGWSAFVSTCLEARCPEA